MQFVFKSLGQVIVFKSDINYCTFSLCLALYFLKESLNMIHIYKFTELVILGHIMRSGITRSIHVYMFINSYFFKTVSCFF